MKRVFIIILALFAVILVMAKDSYIAQPKTGAEYIFTNKTNVGDTIKIETSKYCNDDNLIGYEVVGNKVVRDFSFMHCGIEKELFEYVDDRDVMFDYNLQVGDTLNVATTYETTTCDGYDRFYILEGKHIELLSIDNINYNGVERLKYNLKIKNFAVFVNYGWTTPETERPRDEDYYEYYERNYLGDYFYESWIEGIGYTSRFYFDSRYIEDQQIEQYILQCAFENGENIYTAEGAVCNGLSDNINEKIDLATFTLHRSGDVLMAAFPAAGEGEAITLYDATGRAVTCQPIREGATTASIDVATLPKGVYIARLASGATIKVAI